MGSSTTDQGFGQRSESPAELILYQLWSDCGGRVQVLHHSNLAHFEHGNLSHAKSR